MAKGAYIGVPKPEYEPVFADNTWSQIIKACQKNEVPDTWAVFDQKSMTINGADYAIDIIGRNHDTYADGSGTAPLTFQLHDCYGTAYAMNTSNTNAGGWTDCAMRSTHLPAILALMPSEVQAGIKEVNKLTSAGNKSSTINTTADKLFLLSEIEVFGSVTNSFAGEGDQYAYYAAGNSGIKYNAGTACAWWCRSPGANYTSDFCRVNISGASYINGTASAARYLAYAFCFGGTSEINNTFGGYSVARKIKKGYIGVTEATNLVVDGSFENVSGNWICWLAEPTDTSQAKYGTQSLKLGGDALAATAAAVVLIYGHKYYGREYIKTEGQLDAADCRFELVGVVNGAEKAYVFGWNRGNYPNWSIISNIVTIDHDTTDGFGIRTFTVGGTVNAWVDGLIVIDLTATYGAGNEPTKEWCDANIPFFNGVGAVPNPTGGGVARKIKKAYIGIGGVARPCWSGGELAYYGTATELNSGMYDLSATTVGNYALFGFGYTGSAPYGYVCVYNESLTRGVQQSSQLSRYKAAATTVGDYALFGGGTASGGYYGTVDAYDSSLTWSSPSALTGNRYELAATSVGDYALFGGGLDSWSQGKTTIDAYNKSLTKTNIYTLTARGRLAATTVGGYALFGGGTNSGVLATVEAYDESLTETVLTDLSVARQYLSATTVEDYALFGGGADASMTDLTTVDAYDASLTRTTPTELSAARCYLAATTVGNYALFGGGGNISRSSAVDTYDTALTRNVSTVLSEARYRLAATTVGNYALFGGGYAKNLSSVVDVYTVV